MIHILHVLTCLRLGGAERVLADIVAETDKTRFRHTICYLNPPDDLADELRSYGCTVIRLDAPERHGWLKAGKTLRALIRELKPDLVHSATFGANMAARLACGRSGPPQLSWLVSMEYDPASVRAAGWSPWKNRVYRMLDAAAARFARSTFIACSEAVRRSAIEQLGIPPDRIGVIYNPVRLSAVETLPGEADTLRRQLGLPEDAYVYFNVGRMDAPKGQVLILGAFAQVAAEQRNAHVVIVGRGALERELPARAAALGISERVHIVAMVPRIAPYLEIADVFAFPSLLEGLPVALLEAMCAGVPAAASDIPPHAEVIDDGRTGVLAHVGSADSLAVAMRRLYDDAEARQRIGIAAREEARSRFSTAAVVPQWEAEFTRAAGRRSDGAA